MLKLNKLLIDNKFEVDDQQGKEHYKYIFPYLIVVVEEVEINEEKLKKFNLIIYLRTTIARFQINMEIIITIHIWFNMKKIRNQFLCVRKN